MAMLPLPQYYRTIFWIFSCPLGYYRGYRGITAVAITVSFSSTLGLHSVRISISLPAPNPSPVIEAHLTYALTAAAVPRYS